MRTLWCALLLVGTAGPLVAQGAPSATRLTLEEALSLAKQNNPTYLQSVNGRRRAEAALRSAYGAFLPSASTSLSAGYRQGLPEFFGGVAFGATSDILSSSWGLSFSSRLSARTFTNMRAARAQLDAAQSDLSGAEQTLRVSTIQQYILALQTQARAALQDTLVVSNQMQLDLARAKAGVGSATSLDVKRAEVAVGQQQVAALKAHNTADVELLRLYQGLGVAKPDNVALVSTFAISEPALDPKQLLGMAKAGNPVLRALQSRAQVADANYNAARGDYLPSLSFTASFGGTSQQYKDDSYLVNQSRNSVASSRASCFTTDSIRRGAGLSGISTCNAIVFTDAQASAIRSANEVFPFKFARQPYNISLGLSLPLFDGFSREERLQGAVATKSDAQYNVRAQELRLTADVTAAYTTLVAAYRTARLQENNTAAAREALQLAQERYRVGLNSLVDLQSSRSDYERAQTDLIDANFEFHRAFAALENAVGRPLR
jgi:outer membrane protein